MPCISSNDQSLTIFVVFVNLFPNTPLISVGCGNSQLAYQQLTMERKTKDAKTSQLLSCDEQHDAIHAFLRCISCLLTTQSVFTTPVTIHPFTHIHSLTAGGFSTGFPSSHQELIHKHSQTDGAAIRSSLGFSILLKDT